MAIQKLIAGSAVKSLRALEPDLPLRRLVGGLPSVIPKYDRVAIRNNSYSVIRWWLTVFSIYRVLDAPGKLKLETITDPFKGLGRLEDFQFPLGYLVSHRVLNNFSFPSLRTDPKLRFLETASSSSKVSWYNMFQDLLNLEQAGMLHFVRAYCDFLNYSRISGQIDAYLLAMKSFPKNFPLGVRPFQTGSSIGKLSIKAEPAGKLRVFAMVDVWTQSILSPLHDSLFSFLSQLPNDGTFDQAASVKRSMSKSLVAGRSFSYDLSAATDRLPVIIQEYVLSAIYGERVGSL